MNKRERKFFWLGWVMCIWGMVFSVLIGWALQSEIIAALATAIYIVLADLTIRRG